LWIGQSASVGLWYNWLLFFTGLFALKLKNSFQTSVINCVKVRFLAMNGSILAMNVFYGVNSWRIVCLWLEKRLFLA
jgi:hypothetical protein